jgi:integrase
MNRKYWVCKRGKVYYSFDSETGKRESLHTDDKEEAARVIHARNDAGRQSGINLAIAKAYLAGADPKLVERTWACVMQEYCSKGKESTQQRNRRAIRSEPFNLIRDRKLVESTADDLRAVMKAGGAFTNHFLRCLHNSALGLGWILNPIIPPKLWPKAHKRPKRAITGIEHETIIQSETNRERKSYYELLWEIGAAQTDAANLSTSNIDWEKRLLSYNRQKTGELCVLEIGPRLEALLIKLPSAGPLFPVVSQTRDSWRSAEFRRRCRILKIEGVTLHSYRYAWAARAKQLGMPERFAQGALGHASVAVHREYARDGVVICPSLENYEHKIVPFNSKSASALRNESGPAARTA